MSDESYDKSYEAGRSGGMDPGGNSIDYAGYSAGRQMRASAEASGGGGGGGGAINFKGKVVLVGLGFGMFGMVAGLLTTNASTWGAIVGFVVAFIFGATVRLLIAALVWVLRLVGRILPIALPIVVGFFLGLCVGAVASDQMHTPRQATMIQYGFAGAVILLTLWFLRRLVARKRSS